MNNYYELLNLDEKKPFYKSLNQIRRINQSNWRTYNSNKRKWQKKSDKISNKIKRAKKAESKNSLQIKYQQEEATFNNIIFNAERLINWSADAEQYFLSQESKLIYDRRLYQEKTALNSKNKHIIREQRRMLKPINKNISVAK